MPHFNKGVFRGVKYDAKPVGRRRTISSILRWYRPYAPGDRVIFSLELCPFDDSNIKSPTVDLIECLKDRKPLHTKSLQVQAGGRTHNVEGAVVPGDGALDYRFGLESDADSVIIVSVVASHNDKLIFLTVGAIVTLLVEILAVLIAKAVLGA